MAAPRSGSSSIPTAFSTATITVRFDANVSGGLPWEFQPGQREVTMKIGETAQIALHRRRTVLDTPSAGRATFNVTPELAGAYFNKVECFCFTDTTLKPGEALDMPVVFYVDPDIADVPRTQGPEDDHAFLHLLPDRPDKPVAAAAKADGTEGKAELHRGMTWLTHTRKHHDYHLVDPSPWPFIGAIGAFVMALGGVAFMQYLKGGDFPFFGVNIANPWLFFIGLLIVLYTMFAWWADTIKEAHEGDHTRVVSLHLRYGMIMFIASEVMFFVAWFWAFFDASLFPNEVHQVARTEFTGGVWPPKGIEVLDPFHLPLYNTIILLLSGTTVTWAHHCAAAQRPARG